MCQRHDTSLTSTINVMSSGQPNSYNNIVTYNNIVHILFKCFKLTGPAKQPGNSTAISISPNLEIPQQYQYLPKPGNSTTHMYKQEIPGQIPRTWKPISANKQYLHLLTTWKTLTCTLFRLQVYYLAMEALVQPNCFFRARDV